MNAGKLLGRLGLAFLALANGAERHNASLRKRILDRNALRSGPSVSVAVRRRVCGRGALSTAAAPAHGFGGRRKAVLEDVARLASTSSAGRPKSRGARLPAPAGHGGPEMDY